MTTRRLFAIGTALLPFSASLCAAKPGNLKTLDECVSVLRDLCTLCGMDDGVKYGRAGTKGTGEEAGLRLLTQTIDNLKELFVSDPQAVAPAYWCAKYMFVSLSKLTFESLIHDDSLKAVAAAVRLRAEREPVMMGLWVKQMFILQGSDYVQGKFDNELVASAKGGSIWSLMQIASGRNRASGHPFLKTDAEWHMFSLIRASVMTAFWGEDRGGMEDTARSFRIAMEAVQRGDEKEGGLNAAVQGAVDAVKRINWEAVHRDSLFALG